MPSSNFIPSHFSWRCSSVLYGSEHASFKPKAKETAQLCTNLPGTSASRTKGYFHIFLTYEQHFSNLWMTWTMSHPDLVHGSGSLNSWLIQNPRNIRGGRISFRMDFTRAPPTGHCSVMSSEEVSCRAPSTAARRGATRVAPTHKAPKMSPFRWWDAAWKWDHFESEKNQEVLQHQKKRHKKIENIAFFLLLQTHYKNSGGLRQFLFANIVSFFFRLEMSLLWLLASWRQAPCAGSKVKCEAKSCRLPPALGITWYNFSGSSLPALGLFFDSVELKSLLYS